MDKRLFGFSAVLLFTIAISTPAYAARYLGRYSSNRYDPNSTGNPYGQYGSPYSSTSINNPYSQYGSPYTTNAPRLYSSNGQYLGKVSSNQYDPNSISNPYGRYGSQYSPQSVNNPYGQYGSRYSSQGANNPYATNAPIIIGDGN